MTDKYLQKLDALTHHLRSSWEILRADQPLRVLFIIMTDYAEVHTAVESMKLGDYIPKQLVEVLKPVKRC